MTQTPRRRNIKWLSCLILILSAMFVCWMVIGVSFNFLGQSPLQQLESAKTVWNANHIDDYRMTITFGSFSYDGRFYVTVRDNQIVHIDTVENVFWLAETPHAIQNDELTRYASSVGTYGNFPASLNDYTMDSLFDFTWQHLVSEPAAPLIAWCGLSDINNPDPFRWRSEATFNSQYGYIESFSQTDCIHWDFGGGLMCPAISDCYSGFRIFDFEPIQ